MRDLLLSASLILCLLLPSSALAQTPPATGTPRFGSFAGGPDVINLANLNAHWDIPVFAKAGRGGFNFTYDLTYDSSVWMPVNANGQHVWTLLSGWAGQTEVLTGYITVGSLNTSQSQQSCGPDQSPLVTTVQTYSGWAYVDPFGISHPFQSSSSVTTYSGCGQNSSTSTGFAETAADGSGYTLNVQGYCSPCYATSSMGTNLNAPNTSPNGNGSNMDRNGNQITADGSGHFYDTLNSTTPVLTIAGSGTPASPMTFTYTPPAGSPAAAYTVKYTAYTVKTNFACPGVSEFGPTSENLVSEIDLPDGSTYQFGYEPTAGFAGDVTGRVASVKLSTGGTISYNYPVYSSPTRNNIWCPDGSTQAVTRTTPDGSWTYTRTGTPPATVTTIIDPQGNQSVLNFQGIYETQRQVSQLISGTQTLLRQLNTCYNGAASPCTSTAVTLPINSITVLDQYGSGSAVECKHVYSFNNFGLLTEQDDYDYGAGGPGALLKKTLVTFANLGGSLHAFRQTVTVQDGAGHTVAQTTNNYDETAVTATSGTPQHISISGGRGNLTSSSQLIQGTSTLTSHFSYYDTGTANTATDVNGAVTTFAYGTGSCGNSFPTGVSITQPIAMSRAFTWNCTGGVQLTVTDENGKTVTTAYTDSSDWRPSSVTDQLGNQTSYYYQPNSSFCCPWEVASYLTFNNGNSITSDFQYKDGLGRTYVDQHLQAPGSSNLDSVSYTFDSNGRLNSVSTPCSIGYTGTCATPKTTQTYDALNRPLVTTDGGAGTVTNNYSQNDVYVTIGPSPTGEHAKRRQLEYDSLGRLTSVCEVSGATGSGSCGQTNAQNGFFTKYTYDALGNLLTVTQNAQPGGTQQTRSFTYDGLSRLTSETNPESGAMTYVYDSTGASSCNGGYTSNGDLVRKVDASGTNTCLYYDVLHRLTDVGTNRGSTDSCKRFRYDNTTGVLGSIPSGVAVSNVMGRLVEAETDTCNAWPITPASIITDEWFSYTARGEISDAYQLTPNSGSYYHTSQTYWANGAPASLASNLTGLPSFTYGVDGEGRIKSVSASSGQNPVTNVNYNAASLPTGVTYGSADSDAFSYDANTNRMSQYQFTVNSASLTGALGWNANSTLQTQNVTDAFNSADTQNCSYGYDDFTRLTSANCGSAANQSFTYDPFGNISKSGSPYSFQPSYNSATNRISSISGFTPTYDADGNLTNDNLHTYAWDAYGRPITIDGVTLTYDALGRMVEQNRSGSYTQIAYAPSGAKLALMSGQTIQKAFSPLPGGGTAVYNSSGLLYYGHSDHLGSARFASTPSRTMYFDLAHAPFGEVYANSGSIDPAFTGQRQDTVSGLYDFPAREYSITGRWISPDPAGLAAVDPTNPQSWNRYSYVMNNPLANIDPTGLYCVYLTDAGDTVEQIDDDSSSGECGGSGGYWIAGEFGGGSQISINSDLGLVSGYGYLDGSWQYSVAGAMGSNSWGAWTQTIGALAGEGGDFGALQYQAHQGIRLIKGLTPTTCGGGAFVFLGAQPKKGSVQGFLGGVLEWDSKAGWSGHGLFELGGHGAGAGAITNPLDGLVFLPVGEGSVYGVPVEAGALATTSGAIGAYGEAGKGIAGGGAGAYVNISTVLACGG